MLGKTEGRRKKRWQRMRMVGWHQWLNGHQFEQAPGDGEGWGRLVWCSLWGCGVEHYWELNNKTTLWCWGITLEPCYPLQQAPCLALPIGGARGRLLPVSEGDHGRSQSVSCSVVSHSLNPMDCSLPGSSVHGISQARMGSHSTGVGCHSLLQGILPTQGWNLGLPHCRQILYHLSHQLSPMTTL